MTISEADLELVEQLDRAATRGPWATGKHAGVPNTIVALAAPDVSLLGTESDGQAVFLSKSRTESVSNAEFCAAARELLPRLAAALREATLEADLDTLERLIRGAADCGDNSCEFASQKTGMRPNGGCQCLEGLRLPSKLRTALRLAANLRRELLAENARLKAENEELRRVAYPPPKALHPEDAR